MSILSRTGLSLRWLIERISWILVLFSGITIVAMMVAMTYEVLLRYVFNHPTSWAMEVSMHILVGPVFLAAAYTLLKGGHVRAEFVLSRLPKKVQAVMNIVTSALALIFLVVLTWTIWELVLQSYRGHEYSPGVFPFPLAPVYVTMFIGCVMFCLAVPIKIYEYVKAYKGEGEEIKPATDELSGGV
jgi:TRAP-type C4-dicarboxylate transport system permease small subunit